MTVLVAEFSGTLPVDPEVNIGAMSFRLLTTNTTLSVTKPVVVAVATVNS